MLRDDWNSVKREESSEGLAKVVTRDRSESRKSGLEQWGCGEWEG